MWAAGLLVAGVVLADLVFSPRYMHRVRAAVAAGDTEARVRMYRLTMVLAWSAAGAALVVMLAGGLSLEEIGFTWPAVGTLSRFAPLILGGLLGLAGGAVAGVVASRRGRPVPFAGDVDVLLPRGSVQRNWYTAVALTAGVTEEVFYRALALLFLLQVLPGDATWPAIAVAAVMFGLGHAYQGLAGVAGTAVLAALFGILFLGTGSLLPGMVLHALVDLRALLLRPAADPLAVDEHQTGAKD